MVGFSRAIPLTAALVILLRFTPIPREGRQFVVAVLAAGWLGVGVHWFVRRFGRRGVLAAAVAGLKFAGVAGYAYWRDEPNRRLVAQVRQLGAYSVGTTGAVLTGRI